MKREQLLHVIRAACDLLDVDEVLVVGSQAILAAWPETELPESATRSREADIAQFGDVDEAGSHLLSGVLGEDSGFDHVNGYFVDGVSETTAQLPIGWRDRAIPVETYSAVRRREVVGICPAPIDLCASKLCVLRAKDQEFVHALITAGLVDPTDVRAAIAAVPDLEPLARERATDWLDALTPPNSTP